MKVFQLDPISEMSVKRVEMSCSLSFVPGEKGLSQVRRGITGRWWLTADVCTYSPSLTGAQFIVFVFISCFYISVSCFVFVSKRNLYMYCYLYLYLTLYLYLKGILGMDMKGTGDGWQVMCVQPPLNSCWDFGALQSTLLFTADCIW